MTNYIRLSDKRVFTPAVLESMLGAALPNPALLERAGFAPIDYLYPEYDPDAQRLEPDGDPVPDGDKRYVQRFRVIDLQPEEMARAAPEEEPA